MQPKNVMLLGFINRAVNYIDQHMDDEPNTRLTQLKNIDLIALRDELSSNIDITLGTMQSTMSTLLKAGNEAFDDFISSNQNYYGRDTLSRNFDERLDDSFSNPRNKKSLKELARLLSYYNLDEISEADINPGYDRQRQIQQPVQQMPPQQMPQQVADDDEIMNQIRDNATKNNAQVDEQPAPEKKKENDEAIDSIFTEIIDNEPEHNTTIDSLINDLRKSMQKEDDLVKKNKEVKQVTKQETAKQSSPSSVNTPSQTQNEPVIGEQGYVNDLFGDLKKQLAKEESDKQKDEIKKKEAYNRIGKLYTYLPKSFIRNVYGLKESLSQDYPLDEKIIILHRISFHDVENLRQFVEIGISHGYTINADEEKMIVDIFKEHTNTDGRILTNIYEIANQGYILNGAYEGYNVIVEDE